jgi:GNAT superfamily N-acetyltransferase
MWLRRGAWRPFPCALCHARLLATSAGVEHATAGVHRGSCSRKATVMSNSLSLRELTVEAEPSPDDIQHLEDSIYAFNVRATGISGGKLFGIFLRDDARVAVGGAFGWTWAGTCSVRILFVPIHLRNQGHGTKLMRAVEAEAKARGCRQILLETYDFQAPKFYLKIGFEVRARVSDFLQGRDLIVMAKHLDSL